MARGMDPAKVAQWTARLARFQDAGQTVPKFCEKEGVSPPSFYQWRRKLAAMQQEKGTTGTRSSRRSKSDSAFQEVEVLPATSAVTIRFPGGVEIEMGGDLRALDLLFGRLLNGAYLLNGAASGKEGQPC